MRLEHLLSGAGRLKPPKLGGWGSEQTPVSKKYRHLGSVSEPSLLATSLLFISKGMNEAGKALTSLLSPERRGISSAG